MPDSLLARGIPEIAAPAQQHQQAAPPSLASQHAPPGPSRPLKKARRSSNAFMLALSVIFLLGFVAAAGWMFRESLTELVQRYLPADDGEPLVQLPQPDPVIASAPVENEPEPDMPSDGAKSAAAFDPDEPAPPKATPLSAEERAALASTPPAPTPAMTAPPGDETAMKEVPAGAVTTADGKAAAHVVIEVPEEAKPAAEALMKFLSARDLEERVRHSLAAESMRPLMERYYQEQPEGPVHVDAVGLVRFDPKPQLGGGAHAVFGLESKEWEFPIPVMLEEGKDGFRVDWLSFVEFKDRLLERFFEVYQEGPARFHVGITRTHYFDDQIPNATSKDAFRVSPAPPNPWQSVVFLDKDSALARDLRDRIPWGAQVWAIVELEWVKLGNLKWVQLAAVPQLNWYSVPAASNGQAGGSSRVFPNALPSDAQRAVPVGR